jgi:hypothetical protein
MGSCEGEEVHSSLNLRFKLGEFGNSFDSTLHTVLMTRKPDPVNGAWTGIIGERK